MQPRDITKEIEELNNTYDYTKSYMNDRLKITIRKYKKENKYIWYIQFTSNSWFSFNWSIPADIDRIAKDLWRTLDIEVAKIIYNKITDCYIDTFVGVQVGERPITMWYVGHNETDVVRFLPFEYYEDEIRRMRGGVVNINYEPVITNIWNWWSTGEIPTITNSSYALRNNELCDWFSDKCNSLDEIEYVSQQEYDRLRAQWLSNKKLYLVFNDI